MTTTPTPQPSTSQDKPKKIISAAKPPPPKEIDLESIVRDPSKHGVGKQWKYKQQTEAGDVSTGSTPQDTSTDGLPSKEALKQVILLSPSLSDLFGKE